MAETLTQINQPAPFIEAAAKPFLAQLQKDTGDFRTANLASVYGPQFVAGLDPLQQQAIGQASGLGSYAPFLQTASTRTGPQAYEAFMSPYQRDVIDTTLQEFDTQASKGLGAIADQAISRGAFGGARQNVAESEYRAMSDRNRAALQAQLLQQGFAQGQQGAQQDFLNQLTLAQQSPQLAGQEISGLSSLGSISQGARQAQLTAQQQLAQQQLMQPLEATSALGSGVTSLIAGYPGGTIQKQVPTPSALQTGLSAGATLAGIYGALRK